METVTEIVQGAKPVLRASSLSAGSQNDAPEAPYSPIVKSLALVGIVLVTINLRAAVTSLSAIYNLIGNGVAGFNIGIIGTLPVVCFAVFGVLGAPFSRKVGLERALISAMVMIAIGIGVRASLSHFVSFALFSVLALAGIAFSNVLVIPAIKKYFPDHLGLITAIYGILLTLSSGIPSALAVPIASRFGWRVDVATWGVSALACIVPWSALLLALPKQSGLPEKQSIEGPGTNSKLPSLTRWLPAWSLAVIFGVTMVNMFAMLSWLPTYLISQGVTAAEAGTALFLYSVIGIPHAIIIPMVIAKIKHPIVLVLLAALLQIAADLGLLFQPHSPFLWSSVAGVGLMTINSSLATINLRTKTNHGSAALSGFMQGVGYLIAAAGPFFFGKLHNWSGKWTSSFLLLMAMSVVMAVCAAPANRGVYLEDAQ